MGNKHSKTACVSIFLILNPPSMCGYIFPETEGALSPNSCLYTLREIYGSTEKRKKKYSRNVESPPPQKKSFIHFEK